MLGLSYHLVNLLQSPALDFWQEEEYPERGNTGGWEPDEAVAWAPVEGRGVDEVGCCVLGEPCHQETHCGRKTEGVASEALGGDFAAGEPGIRCNGALFFRVSLIISSLAAGF